MIRLHLQSHCSSTPSFDAPSPCCLASPSISHLIALSRRQKRCVQHRLYQPIHHHITNRNPRPIIHKSLLHGFLDPLPIPLHPTINFRSLPLRSRSHRLLQAFLVRLCIPNQVVREPEHTHRISRADTRDDLDVVVCYGHCCEDYLWCGH